VVVDRPEDRDGVRAGKLVEDACTLSKSGTKLRVAEAGPRLGEAGDGAVLRGGGLRRRRSFDGDSPRSSVTGISSPQLQPGCGSVAETVAFGF
jgi:hypothetical protein